MPLDTAHSITGMVLRVETIGVPQQLPAGAHRSLREQAGASRSKHTLLGKGLRFFSNVVSKAPILRELYGTHKPRDYCGHAGCCKSNLLPTRMNNA